MTALLIGLLALLPFSNVLVLGGGIEVVRLYAILLGMAWLAGYLSDPRNRGRVGSLAPWFLAAAVAATAIAVPFAVDPGASAVRWGRLVVLWLAFTVAFPATLTETAKWRRATVVFVVAGALFGLLNYYESLLSPAALFRELATHPTRVFIRNAFAFGGGVEGHGHEVGHFTSFAILFTVGLLVTVRQQRERWLLVAVLVIAAGALLISFTKSAWAGAVVGLIVFYRRTRLGHQAMRWSWVPVAVVLFLAVGFWLGLPPTTRDWLLENFLFRDASGQVRLVLWTGALELARAHPVVGAGLNSLPSMGRDPHNWWLGILAEGGLVSFGFAVAFFVRLWRELTPVRHTEGDQLGAIRGAAAAVVVSIAFQGLFEASFLWDFPTWAALGLATSVAGWPSAAPVAAVAPRETVASPPDDGRVPLA